MTPLNVSSIGLGGKASICWSFFWRGFVMMIGSMLAGGVLGGVFGAIVGAIGLSKGSALAVMLLGSATLGALAGLTFLYLYIRWLLSSRLGRFRLVLVLADDAAAT